MNFFCEKALLQNAITVTGRAVSVKSSIPAMEGILLEAEQDLKLTGYNLHIGITNTISAEISVPGRIVVPARLFTDIVRRMPDDMIHLEVTDRFMVKVSCGNAEFNFAGIDPLDYPELPPMENNNAFTIQQRHLKNMINQTRFSVSSDNNRLILTGIYFEVGEDLLTMVAIDGFRMALRKEPIISREKSSDFSFIVPGTSLSEVEHICEDSEEPITIHLGEHQVFFQKPNFSVVCRLLEGTYMNYQATIPKTNPIQIYGDTKELLESIERVSLIIADGNKSPIRCTVGQDIMKIVTRTALGDA